MCPNPILNFSVPLSAILVLKSGMPCLITLNVQALSSISATNTYSGIIALFSVMLDVFMNDEMSCSICKHCTCMYMYMYLYCMKKRPQGRLD